MIDPETGAWREMIDPTTRKPGRALQLTVGHADSVGEQLFAHEDADQAHVHPIELMGDLYQTRTVLRCLEDALWRHPLHDYVGEKHRAYPVHGSRESLGSALRSPGAGALLAVRQPRSRGPERIRTERPARIGMWIAPRITTPPEPAGPAPEHPLRQSV